MYLIPVQIWNWLTRVDLLFYSILSVTRATRDQTGVEIIKEPGWKHSKFGRVYLEIILLAPNSYKYSCKAISISQT